MERLSGEEVEGSFRLVMNDLKDLVEIYRVTPDHLKKTLATYIKGSVECLDDYRPPYGAELSDECKKEMEDILREVNELLPKE